MKKALIIIFIVETLIPLGANNHERFARHITGVYDRIKKIGVKDVVYSLEEQRLKAAEKFNFFTIKNSARYKVTPALGAKAALRDIAYDFMKEDFSAAKLLLEDDSALIDSVVLSTLKIIET